jgi:hypothetical protein
MMENPTRTGFIKCPECKLEHQIQEKSAYKPNKLIEKALKIEPIKVTRGIQFEQFLQSTQQKISELVDTIQKSESLIGESESKISEFCSKLKNQIDLSVEIKIEQLNKYRDEYLKRIKDYEQECTSNLNNNLKTRFIENNSNLKKAEAWSELVKKPSCPEDTIKEIKRNVQDMKADMDVRIRMLEQSLFCNKVVEFKSHETALKKEDIGVLSERNSIFGEKPIATNGVFLFGSPTPPAISFSGDVFAKEKGALETNNQPATSHNPLAQSLLSIYKDKMIKTNQQVNQEIGKMEETARAYIRATYRIKK